MLKYSNMIALNGKTMDANPVIPVRTPSSWLARPKILLQALCKSRNPLAGVQM